MNEFEQQLFDKIEFERNERLWQINSKASKQMKRLGIMCCMLILLDIAIALLVTRFSIFMLISISVCFITAIFDFYKSRYYAIEAEKHQNKRSY